MRLIADRSTRSAAALAAQCFVIIPASARSLVEMASAGDARPAGPVPRRPRARTAADGSPPPARSARSERQRRQLDREIEAIRKRTGQPIAVGAHSCCGVQRHSTQRVAGKAAGHPRVAFCHVDNEDRSDGRVGLS